MIENISRRNLLQTLCGGFGAVGLSGILASEQARAAGDRIKGSDTAASVLAGQSAAKACPVLYQACQAAFPKACSDQISPVS